MVESCREVDQDCSLVIIHYGDVELTTSLLNSLAKHPDRELFTEIIVVDNGDKLDRLEVRKIESIIGCTRVIANNVATYSGGVNKGANEANSSKIIVVNNDVEWIEGESIKPALSTLSRENVGVVGVQQVYPDGSWQRSSGPTPSIANILKSTLFIDTARMAISKYAFNNDIRRVNEVEYVDGAFLLVDNKAFEDTNGFDENFDFYAEEADFCYRAKKQGWRIVSDTRSRVIHIGGASSSDVDERRYAKKLAASKGKFVRKHYGRLHDLIYKGLYKFSLAERVCVYYLLHRFSSGEQWKKHYRTALIRFQSTN